MRARHDIRGTAIRAHTTSAGAALLVAAQIGVLVAGCAPAQNPIKPAAVTGQAAAASALAESSVAQAAPRLPATAPEALAQAQRHLVSGDYARARDELSTIRTSFAGTPEAAEAAFTLAQAALMDDQTAQATATLKQFLADHPEHPDRVPATLMLGRLVEASDGGAAVAAYERYEGWAEAGASLGDVLYLRAATIFFGVGRVADGWAALSKAAAAADKSGSTSARVRVYDALGTRYLDAGNRASAAAAWEVALASLVQAKRPAQEPAALAWKLAGLYQELGRPDQASTMRWRIVGEWPRTAVALQAMNSIGASTVPAGSRGLIAYHNGRWAQAVEALTWYLNAGAPEGQADEFRYYRAIALLRMGDDETLAAFERVAERHPESAWAPEALWEAGSLLLRQGNYPAAAARFERLAVGYPASPKRGQALYQLGRILPELGNVAGGHRYMEAAATSGYEDFYTFRARAILKQPLPAPTGKSLEDQEQISPADVAAWEQWLAARGRTVQDQAARRTQAEADPRFRRGAVLLDAGFAREAEEEFRELLDAVDSDPVVVALVAKHVRDRGFYSLSVTLGHRVLSKVNQMGESSLLAAPRLVQKLVLPLAFIGLVEPAAKAKNLDPLLMLGLMKQESWFQPRAASSAAARGLTQFILPTARTVADELRWPNWTWDDMNKPYVSIPFGAHYLSSLIKDFRGNYYFALAGYNGGPGNVLRWAKGDWNRDTTLFVEEVTYVETRNYLKAVTSNYDLYRLIYYR